ncbi:protein of unassigned function [Methylobacterium oryzae CBMB20]|uniref:Protein of unassigned function n=1 Tax=Methylobacterium oryzae CBMB20 TaxID=693986 RepID=A0A089Q6E2_9HYPH|nr:protein of unassigned function [Methylobacterium oryzae CBMB20]
MCLAGAERRPSRGTWRCDRRRSRRSGPCRPANGSLVHPVNTPHARLFDGGVERQQIGLSGDPLDQGYDLADLRGLSAQPLQYGCTPSRTHRESGRAD